MSVAVSAIGALGLTSALVVLHLAAPLIRDVPGIAERCTASFAGGTAVAYVFLHLLPEVAAGNEVIGELLRDVLHPTALLELGIFAVALAGFTVFFGLERLAGRQRNGSSHGDPPAAVYWVHLASFVGYNVLITYTMALRLRTGVGFALLFTVAMGLHFVLTDRGLKANHPRRFRASGRYVLAIALLLGWGLDALFTPTNTLVVSLLTAFLGGAILLNVFKEEVPSERQSSFPWFLAGLVLYAAMLTSVTALSET